MGDKGVFDLENPLMANRFKAYGRCVTVMDARVYDIYGAELHADFEHHGLGLEVFPLGIDEQQKSMRTVEEVMVFFANVGVMRREKPLVAGGGLITDIVGTACSLYRRSTSYIRLPTTLIGMIDAAIAIKVGGNLAEKHKNRIGAFHPHDGVIIDFHLLKSLPEAHIRNGLAELTKISIVEEPECFELLEEFCQDVDDASARWHARADACAARGGHIGGLVAPPVTDRGEGACGNWAKPVGRVRAHGWLEVFFQTPKIAARLSRLCFGSAYAVALVLMFSSCIIVQRRLRAYGHVPVRAL